MSNIAHESKHMNKLLASHEQTYISEKQLIKTYSDGFVDGGSRKRPGH